MAAPRDVWMLVNRLSVNVVSPQRPSLAFSSAQYHNVGFMVLFFLVYFCLAWYVLATKNFVKR